MANEDLIAVVDLGSNSFHMAIASIGVAGIRIVDRVKHKVYLSSGLDQQGNLDEAAIARGVEAMKLFSQRLKDETLFKVRIVATHTLRVANNAHAAIDAFRQVLDYPVDIIDGIEEARLIYTAVAHTSHHDAKQRLVVDIGGGSTELVIGENYQPKLRSSHSLGSNLFSKEYFDDEVITREHFDRAIERIESVLEIYYRAYKRAGWQVAIGTSGTIKYIGALVSGGKAEHVITYDKLIGLRDQIISKGSVKGCNFKNVPLDRQQILPGGLAVLIGVFELLQIDELHYEDAGLREGVIYQELWHLEHPDIRERSVQDLLARHKVDAEQVGRIEATAVGVFDQLATGSNLGYYRNMLRWAANLHEVGRSIRIQGVHDHSKYIVTHSPMPGFSIEQQSVMAWLVGNHRKGISLEPLTEFHQHQARLLRLVLMCLRIAVTLHRSRGSIDELPMATVDTSDQKDVICLSFSKSWLDEHALSAYDLAQEAKRWQKRGWLLQVIALA